MARRLGLPAVLGYLAVGLIVSPFTPGFVADRGQIELLAEFGVVLLLFEVGIEIDVGPAAPRAPPTSAGRALPGVRDNAPAGALFYRGRTGAGDCGSARAGRGASSSVVIVNIVRSRKRTTDPSDRVGHAQLERAAGHLRRGGGRGAALGRRRDRAFVRRSPCWGCWPSWWRRSWPLLGSRWCCDGLRSEPDLFLIVSIGWGSCWPDWGRRCSGSRRSRGLHRRARRGGVAGDDTARGRLVPFRDVFAVLFFVSVGTLIDPSAVRDGLPWVGLILLALVVGKVLVTAGASRWAGVSRPWQLAMGSGQIGEMSFVLASLLAGAGLLAADVYAALLFAVVVSIAVSAVLARVWWSRPADLEAGGERAPIRWRFGLQEYLFSLWRSGQGGAVAVFYCWFRRFFLMGLTGMRGTGTGTERRPIEFSACSRPVPVCGCPEISSGRPCRPTSRRSICQPGAQGPRGGTGHSAPASYAAANPVFRSHFVATIRAECA